MKISNSSFQLRTQEREISLELRPSPETTSWPPGFLLPWPQQLDSPPVCGPSPPPPAGSHRGHRPLLWGQTSMEPRGWGLLCTGWGGGLGWGVAFTPPPAQRAPTPRAGPSPCCTTLSSPTPTWSRRCHVLQESPSPHCPQDRTLHSRKLPQHTVPRLSEGLRAGPSEPPSGFAARSRGTQAHWRQAFPSPQGTWCPSATGKSPKRQGLLSPPQWA